MTGPPEWGRLLSNIPLPVENLAGIAAGVALQRAIPLRTGLAPSLVRVAGVASLAAGGLIVTWAWLAARPTRLAHPDSLVTAGPYGFSRNPMYVGWALLHLGSGLLRDDAWTLAALPLSSAVVHRQVLREEESLAASFPGAYNRYCLSVPRYVPSYLPRPRRAADRVRLRAGAAAGTPSHAPRRSTG